MIFKKCLCLKTDWCTEGLEFDGSPGRQGNTSQKLNIVSHSYGSLIQISDRVFTFCAVKVDFHNRKGVQVS